jgi:ribosomal protein S21
MPKIKLRDGESIDKALRRLKRITDEDKTKENYIKHTFYEKPSIVSRDKRKKAVARRLTKQRQEEKVLKALRSPKNKKSFR